MKLHIQDFDASIETKPFIIIIGKNNVGKSYCVELFYTVLQLQKMLEHIAFSYEPKPDGTHLIELEISSFEKDRLIFSKPKCISIKTSDLKVADEEFAKNIINQTMNTISAFLERYVPLVLVERFGIKIEELVNANAENAIITISFSEYVDFSFKIFRNGTVDLSIKYFEENFPKLIKLLMPNIKKIKNKLRDSFSQLPYRQAAPMALFETVNNISETLLGVKRNRHRYPKSTGKIIYIPAGRAGLLEGYYSVSSAYFSLATVALPRGVSMPAMPPTASVFYNLLMEFVGGTSGMSEVAKELADSVMGGEIILEPDNRQPALKKIIYKPFTKSNNQTNIDIIHAGSMVKELAGLYLAIKETILPGIQLIVEEPESHLHPSAQKKLAKVLMNLSSKNVKIIITTHSDIILREVAHLVGKFPSEEKSVLPSKDVAVVLLKECEKGSVSENLEIPKSGILKGVPTFDEVILELYDEEIELENTVE